MSHTETINRLSPELAKRALEEINERPEECERNIEALRKLIAAEEDLVARTDDAFLLRFLRSCEHDVEWAFQTVRKYYLAKVKYPELYSNFRPSAMLKTFNENLHMILPGRDELGRRVILMRLGQWNPSTCTTEDGFICLQMCLESIIDEEETQVCGIVFITDLQDFNFRQAVNISPGVIKKFASFVQEYYPARFQAYHIVNEPSVFEAIHRLTKIFFKKDIVDRIQFHGRNLKSLHQYISPDMLPEELGGSNPPSDNSSMVKSLVERDDEIADSIANYGYRN